MNPRCHLLALAVLTFAAQSHALPLFERGASWRWRPGTSEASTPVEAWRLLAFNDTEFTQAPAPFWYGDALPGGTEITGMSGVYYCIFLRLPFVVTNVSEISGLRLGALVDDGFVAWINGTEVLRVNETNPPNTAITISNLFVNAAPDPAVFNTYTLPDPAGYLVVGTNLLAVQVGQSSLTSSDLGFDASLEAILIETNPPTIVNVSPAPDSTLNHLTELTVTFSEPVTGVDGFDLRVNDAPAFGLTAINNTTYRFTFLPPAYGAVQITWDAAHGIADEALPPNPFDRFDAGSTWQYILVDNTPPLMANIGPAAGATVRSLTNLTVLFSEPVTGVDVTDLEINGTAATGFEQRAADLYRFSFPQPDTGLVQVAWIAAHGIADRSPAANAFAGGDWTYVLDPTAETLLPYISEFMALNSRTVGDDNGLFSDWIEIHNPSPNPVNLDGWYLTDTTNNLTKWRFPATNLVGGEFLLVWASGDNRRVPGAPLHASFALSAGGEYLALVKPDGVTVASEYFPTFPPQAADVSYGIGSLTTNETVIATNAPVRLRVPADGNDALTWTTPGYDDSSWTLGTNGVGYGSTNATSADYGASVLPTQPVGYWRLSETTGTTAANAGSGAGLNGTYSGATLGTPGPRPPQFGGFEGNNNAPTFNGSSSYVTVNNSVLSGRGAFTIAGWINCASTSFDRTGLFGQNDCVEFGFISASTLQCWTPGGGSVNATYTPTVGTWFHVAAVGDGSTLRIFVNGAQAASGGGATASYGSSTFPFNIGGNGVFDATLNFFNGQIDEVGVWHRALTTTEILGLYEAGLQPAVVAVTPYVLTDIGAAMSNVNASVYLRLPFTVDDPARVALLTLRMRYDDGFAAFINGAEVARAHAPASLAYDAAATEEHSPAVREDYRIGALGLQAGENVLAIQGLNFAAGNEDFLAQAELIVTYVAASSSTPLYFSPATPGYENVGGVVYPGPSIVQPAHSPNVPLDDQDLLVTARVVPTFNALGSVVMRYRVMFDPELEVAMFDDGLHGDGLPGDGVYAATIPASAATNSQMIRWFIRATDALGNASRWPLFEAAAGSESAEYLGTIVNADYVTSKVPIIHLYAPPNILGPGPGATAQTGADSETGSRVSLFYDGEFYDNVYMELRGNTTAGYNKKSHRFQFNRDHLFRHAGLGFGKPDRPAPRIRNTSFVADYPDPTYMRQGLTFWLCDLIGSPGSFYYPVRLQLNGQFYQLANHNDVQREDLLERIGFDPNGALYRSAGQVRPTRESTGGFVKRARLWDNDLDYLALSSGINETNSLGVRATNFFEQFDVPNVLNYLVAARWAHENDDVWANMSLYHDNDGDNLWRIIAFDVNLSWGAIFYEGGTACQQYVEGVQSTNDAHKAHPLYGSSQTLPCGSANYNRVYDTVFQVPQLREMFLRRLRTMMDTYVKPPGTPADQLPMEKKVLEWQDLILEEAERDRNYWGWPGKGGQCNFDPGIRLTNGVTAMINEFIVKRREHFYVKHSVANTALPIGITKSDNAGIPLAQTDDVFLSVVAVEANPASGNQAEEYLALANSLPVAIDISGWELSGAVRFTFHPGTVIAGNSVVYVSPDVRQFRARATAPRGGQGLFIVGPYDGQLSARGETIYVADQEGRVVTFWSYAGNPSPAQEFLRITELMYNPAPLAGDPTDPQAFEYVKLKNLGPDPLDLTGVRFTNGIYFDFTGSAVTSLAPGATVLIVPSTNAFTARYGPGFAIAGEYTGLLDNGGERLRLIDSLGEEILDFEFNNAWYPITDGLGFSLVVVNEQAEPDLWASASNWRPSGSLDGAPGDPAPSFPVFAAIVVNEVLTHTELPDVDVIELFNPHATNVNLGGWFLTDDFATPKKYRIPDGTLIPALDFLCFNELQFNPNPGVPPSFALDADGDEVYLFSGDANTNLTGYVHGFDYGAIPQDVSFGRHVISTGADHFVAQSALTLSNVNAGPLVGPIVISEIMYRPPDLLVDGQSQDNNQDEYVELSNGSAATAPLYDPNHPTNTWRLRDAVAYTFPTNVSLPAGGRLLVVSFDPAHDEALESFRARNQVPVTVPVYGPWQGELNNASDRVELVKPDVPDAIDGDVPAVLVERVSYADAAPWPSAADGLGYALQRRDLTAYANDPANWVAAIPSAGTEYPGGELPVITLQPADQTVAELQPAAFSVSVQGSGPFAYAWHYNGAAVPGATNATLAISSAQVRHVGNYAVLVSSAAGAILSRDAALRIQRVPFITSPPQDVSVIPGASVEFSVGALGTGPLTYQWLRNGVNVPGATGPTLSVANAQLNVNDGYYSVVVTDDIGSRESPPGRLIVRVRPTITQQLAVSPSTTVPDGRSFTFTISASGTWPMGFRFRAPGAPYYAVPIAESNNATITLTVENAKSNLHNGNWDVGITNLAGSALSTRLTITVVPAPPFFTIEPTNQTVTAGTDVAVVSEARGTDPIGYQWYSQSTGLLQNETNASLVFSNASSAIAGEYYAVAVNSLGSATSAVAQVSLASGPGIVTQPADQSVTPCDTATFTVTASGAPPLTYQWFFDTTVLPGANGPTLTIPNPRPADEGAYYVVVTEAGGSLTSVVATLTLVLGDCDGDGMADTWELANGLNPASAADRDLDADGDGRTNWEEHASGTDPNDGQSVLRARVTKGGGALIEFTAMPSVGYTIQYTLQLGSGNWQSLSNLAAQASSRLVQVLDAGAAGGNRYYRIVTPLQPE